MKHLFVVILKLLNSLSLLLLQSLYGLIAFPFKLILLIFNLSIMASLLLLQASLIFLLQTLDFVVMRLFQLGNLLFIFLAELIS